MAKKISCPQCDQKFKTETGRDWHIDHIPILPKQSTGLISQTGTMSLATGKIKAQSAGQAGLQQELLRIKNLQNRVDNIEEGLNCRLDTGLKRAIWLSERVSALEENCPNIHRTESG
jgi:hypothetical protein